MRQIGARQEASRLGGIGSCGRELCCSTWLTDFRTVNTSAARYQQLSLNPLKLAGQCGKLKCCLNYELDSYVDALKEFPDMDGKKLLTKKGDAFLQKTDIFKRMMWFSYRSEPGVFIPLDVKAVHSIIEANKNGETPDALVPSIKLAEKIIVAEPNFENVVGQDSLTRFDRKGGKSKANFKGNRNPGKPNQAFGQKAKPQNQNRPPQNQNQNKPQAKTQGKQQGKPNNKPNDKPRNPQQNRKPNPPRNDNKPNP